LIAQDLDDVGDRCEQGSLTLGPDDPGEGLPSVNMTSVGMEINWNSGALAGLASTLTLATVITPALSLAMSSSTGATILNCPHQGAQKSTSTGIVLFRG